MKRLIFVAGMLPISALANVPEGFGELFENEKVSAQLVLNDAATYNTTLNMSLASAQMAEDADELSKWLREHYVKPDIANQIANDLISGVEDSTQCRGRRETCQIEPSDHNAVQYVIVRSQESLRILVPASGMSTTREEKRYVTQQAPDSALIMHHNLSVNGNDESDSQAYYHNEATLGVMGGFIRADTRASTDEANNDGDNVYFDELAAHYLVDNHRFKVGYSSENSTRVWNSTAVLDTDEKQSVVEVSAGTTHELEFDNDAQSPRIYFSVPQSGRLTVRREDGTPVLERNVSAGQHFIAYDELPLGIAQYSFEVKAGETSLYSEVHKIYNTGGSRLAPGEWDYFVSLGQFTEQDVIHSDQWRDLVDTYEDETFAEVRIATQLTQDLRAGLGLINTADDHYAKVALGYQPLQWLSANALYGRFSDESYYVQSSLSLFGLHFQSSRFADRSDRLETMSLSNYLLGYGSSREWSASYAHPIGDGRAYLNYSQIESEALFTILQNGNNEWVERYESLTLGYGFSSWLNSTVDLSVTYADDEDENGRETDEWSFALSVSIPLTRSAYANYSLSQVDDYVTHRAALGNHYQLSSDTSVGVEVGTTYDSQNTSDEELMLDASLSGQYNNQYLSSSAFAYADRNSSSVSANLSSTTVISPHGINQTREKAESYLLVSNHGATNSGVSIEEQQSDFLSVANVKANGDADARLTVDRDQILQPLQRYKEYQVTLDEAASDFHNRGESNAQGTSYPGTIINMQLDMREMRSYISVFDDIEGRPVNEVTCQGLGCVDVEELSSGVFKFRVSAGLPFQLRTEGQRCLIPSPDSFESQNLGHNFCMPSFEEEEDGLHLSRGDNGEYYYYLGEFKDEEIIQSYQEQLQDEPITFVEKKVGNRIFLFVETSEPMIQTVRAEVVGLTQYAVQDTLDAPTWVMSK